MTDHRSICIHAHFYQPPREDIFTGSIPEEPGATPYRNWNERVLETCYRPNAELRNFSKLSFNIGPTLADWLQKNASDILGQIVKEDVMNQAIYGAGNAMAQPYNHRILPLANSLDKQTQISWGISAFEAVFGRHPEGMWLPEAAVDTETLRIMADMGVSFTILAPWQVEVLEGQSPYRIDLGEGKTIIAFIYHGGLSSTMSFDTFATGNADAFADFYIKPEIDPYNAEQLVIIATDGELYGHHQPFRDQFLAHLMNGAVKRNGLSQTWPGLWLKQHEVKGKAKIRENTSWSCHHGVERWRDDCGCTPRSIWKQPLKTAFDELNQDIFKDYCIFMQDNGIEPIQSRNEYIKVEIGQIDLADCLETLSTREFDEVARQQIHIALQAQSACQKMFTSCGWFFGDLGRIEPRNNIRFAAQAAVLMHQLNGKDYSKKVISMLEKIEQENNNGTTAEIFRSAYDRFVKK